MKRILVALLCCLLALILPLGAVGCADDTPLPEKEDSSPDAPTPQEPAPQEPETPTPQAPQAPAGPQPSDILSAASTVQLSMTELLAVKKHTDDNGVSCRVMQGGCTDGTYYYVALNDGQNDSADSVSAIRKYDLATGRLLATFEDLHIAHCNDLAYNPDTNEILAVHNQPERWVISVFDRDSMELKRKITLDAEIYSLAYDPFEKCYWAGLSYGFDFIKLGLDFKQIGDDYTGMVTGYTKQGMDVDEKYIYFCQYKKNSLIVYDKNGNYVRELLLPKTDYEAENVCHVGNVFYIGYYTTPGGGTLYKTEVCPVESKTVGVTMSQLSVLDRYTDPNGKLYKVPQGSCTDGTYLYQAMNNDINTGYLTVIQKIDPQTGQVLATSSPFSAGLSNGMTYNTVTGQIVLAHNTPETQKISFIDPDTLTPTSSHTLSFHFYTIAYDAVRNGYWLGLSGTYDLTFISADLTEATTYSGYNTGYTKQANDCDGQYVYMLQSAVNAVVIYRTNGILVGVVELPVTSNSAQSICHIGNTFYIAYNVSSAGGILYTATVSIT